MQDADPGIDHGNSSKLLPEEFQRQAVFYRSQHPVGTIIIDTRERHLYLIQSETRALRYGIGVGRDGFTWAGLLRITRKVEWPDWRPPPEIVGASLIFRALWQAGRVIRLVPAPCFSARCLPRSRH